MKLRNTPRSQASLVVGVLIVLLVACVDLRPTPTPTPTTTPRPTAVQTFAPPTLGATARPGETPGPTQNPVNTGSAPPPPSSGPGATIDPALAAQIDEVISQVPAVRELAPESDVPYEFVTREQFREDLIELAFAEIPEETRAAEERMLKRLGLLAPDADLEQLLIDLYGGQVAAFYRPDTKRFYIIAREEPFGATDKVFVAHEYAHALQDQHFDLEGTRIKDLSEGDAALGQLAAVEGDATLTMQLWAQNNLSPQEFFELLLGGLGQLDDPTLASMPPILRRQLEFPYSEGYTFVQDVHTSGGFAAVNELLQDPPESTEQILHAEKYYADEQPVDVTLPDVLGVLGEGWSTVYEQTMGELLMQVWLAADEAPVAPIPGFPVEWPHADAAAGWAGDRLQMYEHPDGRWALAWQIAWDTAADASEFAIRAHDIAPTIDPATIVTSETSLILTASDVSIVNVMDTAFIDTP